MNEIVTDERWRRVTFDFVEGKSGLTRVGNYFGAGTNVKLYVGAAALWSLLVPWRTALIVLTVATVGGFCFRRLQLFRARRAVGSGPYVTFRISAAELRSLPFDRPPLLGATRECVVLPRLDRLYISAVADGRRPLVCDLSYVEWSLTVTIDDSGRAHQMVLIHQGEVVLRKPALGSVPVKSAARRT